MPNIQPLFEELRTHILDLAPSISEEFFKRHIAYKLDLNLLYLLIRKTWIRIVLNIDYQELNDPKGMAEDLSVWKRGSGSVAVNFSRLDELPYIMDLIRQTLEKQM